MLEAFSDPKTVLLSALEGAKNAAGGAGCGGSRNIGRFLSSVPEPAVSEANMLDQVRKEDIDVDAFHEEAVIAVSSCLRAAAIALRH